MDIPSYLDEHGLEILSQDIKSYVAQHEGSQETPKSVFFTINPNDWEASGDKYVTTVAVEDVTANTVGIIGPALIATDEERNEIKNSKIMLTSQTTGALIFSANKSPTMSLPMMLNIMGSGQGSNTRSEYFTIPTSAWTYQSYNKYTATVSVNGVTPDTIGATGLSLTATEEQWTQATDATLTLISQGTNSLSFSANRLIAVDLSLVLNVIK